MLHIYFKSILNKLTSCGSVFSLGLGINKSNEGTTSVTLSLISPLKNNKWNKGVLLYLQVGYFNVLELVYCKSFLSYLSISSSNLSPGAFFIICTSSLCDNIHFSSNTCVSFTFIR